MATTMKRKTTKPIIRFRKHIHINPVTLCWEWGGNVERPSFWNGERYELVYRFSYSYFIGNIPEGLFVCHRCDNPRCCNPSHLFLGTCADNMADAVRKGRMSSGPRHSGFQPVGESVYCAKLTVEDVLWIRKNYIPRHPEFGSRAMARKFGVSHAAIGYARRGDHWKSVTPESRRSKNNDCRLAW